MNLPMHLSLIDEKDDVLYVPAVHFRRWVEQRSFPKLVMFGTHEQQCRVHPHPDQKNEYMISTQLAKKLLLPDDRAYYVIERDHTLRIGPVVGILTAGFTPASARPIGERSLMFAKMLATSAKMGIAAFVFGPHHIDWNNRTIKGYIYMKNRWQQITFPFPDVIYDRLPNRKSETMDVSSKTKDRFMTEHSITWFNPGFFDKWSIHQLLLNSDSAKTYLPDTITSPDEQSIEDFLDKYGSVYVKPSNGSLGIGIQQLIKKKGDPHYYCRFRTGTRNRLRRYTSLRRLLKRQFSKGMDSYMAQRGIHLLSWNGNPIDFRVHTNKDRSGRWQVSAIAAKQAGEGSVTTHVTSGGRVLSIQELFHEIGKPKAIVNAIQKAALDLSESLSENIKGLIGEIGFDLGVDEDDKVWMFEANSKPGRSIFIHPDMKGYEHKTRSLPFEYCIYLFEQSRKQTESVIK
ncbi:YheC/YheD family protein [Alkalihalobacillus sp. AL-G]|uniref:YheC/YheD family endospore coat-associated protein n=1 Tax=Alkalihalobacillus sp. AL-G TaxID=2926399 RepID=UPI00272AD5C0|nr:YheC/YheD family protein [Alkalihalobacillus sp. AL-G]WLD94045.1 YheC/YheD family protein [Alkalihalobacillus sp. AL-G]